MTTATCLCGKTWIKADPNALKWCGHCHCDSCRRASGAPLVTWAGYRASATQFGGDAAVQHNSSPGTVWSRCATCGSLLTYASHRWPDEVHITAALLDNPPAPQFHVHWAARPNWIDYADDLPRHARTAPAGEST